MIKNVHFLIIGMTCLLEFLVFTMNQILEFFFFLLYRFIINFQTGDSNGDDIAFHINPQLGRHVAINSFRNGSWDTEESVSDKPFIKGASFNVFVVIKSEHYEVYTLN